MQYKVQSGIILKMAKRLFNNNAYVLTIADLYTSGKMLEVWLGTSQLGYHWLHLSNPHLPEEGKEQ